MVYTEKFSTYPLVYHSMSISEPKQPSYTFLKFSFRNRIANRSAADCNCTPNRNTRSLLLFVPCTNGFIHVTRFGTSRLFLFNCRVSKVPIQWKIFNYRSAFLNVTESRFPDSEFKQNTLNWIIFIYTFQNFDLVFDSKWLIRTKFTYFEHNNARY